MWRLTSKASSRPVTAQIPARVVALGRIVELSCSLRGLLSQQLLLGPCGVDALDGVADGKAAELVGLGPQHVCGLRDAESEVEPGPPGTPRGLVGHDLRDHLTLAARRQRRVQVSDPGFDPLRWRLIEGGLEA